MTRPIIIMADRGPHHQPAWELFGIVSDHFATHESPKIVRKSFAKDAVCVGESVGGGYVPSRGT